VVREIMVFLHSNGVGTARAVRIYKTYGADAVQVMSENPYRLARDIRGIGFKTADAIAMKLGIEKTAMIRVRAGISYALTEAMDEGHCGLPTDQLGPLAEDLLEVPRDLIDAALELELREGAVIADQVDGTPCIFLAGLYRAEQTIANRLASLKQAALPWQEIDADKAIPWIEEKTRLELAATQRDAIRLALSSKVTVITGGPGVGKTNIVNSILRILAAKRVEMLLCAPTGRAASPEFCCIPVSSRLRLPEICSGDHPSPSKRVASMKTAPSRIILALRPVVFRLATARSSASTAS
jgi:exodeoxyribonuclease V alpha subunit